MPDPSARAALLALAAHFTFKATIEQHGDRAVSVWRQAAEHARHVAQQDAHGLPEGETAPLDGGEAGDGSVALRDAQMAAEAVTADVASLLSNAMLAYEPQATASMAGTPRSLLSVLLEAARRAVETAAPAIRARERERIAKLADEHHARYRCLNSFPAATVPPTVIVTETSEPFADLIREQP